MRKGRGRGRVGGVGPGKGRGRGRGGQSVGQFLAPRNGRQAGAVANAAASAEYNPEIRELRSQAKGSRQREADLGQWYAQLAADYQGAQDAGSAALQSIQDATGKQLAEASGRSSADLSKLSADDDAFAKLTGGPKDTEGLARIAQAGAAAERSRVALNLPTAQEQANFVGRLGGEKTSARMRGIEARGEERDRREKIRSDLTGVRKEKGAARVSHKEEIREADRGYATELKKLRMARQEARSAEQAAAADAALARVESARQAQSDAVAARQAQERVGISRRNARTSERSQRETAKDNHRGGLSPAEKRSRGEHSHDAMSEAKNLLAIKVPKTPKQWAQFQAALTEKMGSSYSAEAARAVAKLRKMQAQKNRGGYEQRIRKGTAIGPPAPSGR